MPSDRGQVVIGVDLDGVCADFYTRMREIAAEWFEVDASALAAEVSYGLTEWGIATPEQYQSLHRFAVTQRDLCFMKDKDQVGADIYIEDNPHNIDQLRRHGHDAICFANSTNRHIEVPRAGDWKAVAEMIRTRAPLAP